MLDMLSELKFTPLEKVLVLFHSMDGLYGISRPLDDVHNLYWLAKTPHSNVVRELIFAQELLAKLVDLPKSSNILTENECEKIRKKISMTQLETWIRVERAGRPLDAFRFNVFNTALTKIRQIQVDQLQWLVTLHFKLDQTRLDMAVNPDKYWYQRAINP